MKAERRHELQTNSLALWLKWRLPQVWQDHGTKILLGLIVVALAIVVIRWRINAPIRARENAEAHIGNARQLVSQVRMHAQVPADASRVPDFIKSALNESDDPDVQARAYLTLGDYYNALANWVDLPTTQPSAGPEMPPTEALSKAREAYQKAMDAKPTQVYLRANSRLALGQVLQAQAIEAMDKAGLKADPKSIPQWAAAREQFEAVANDTATPPVLRDIAQRQIERMPQRQKPVWVAQEDLSSLLELSTRPTTQPATLVPAVPAGPELPPTTRPARPTPVPSATRPATRP